MGKIKRGDQDVNLSNAVRATFFKRLFRALLYDIRPEKNGDITIVFSDGERTIAKEQVDHVLYQIFK